MEYDSPLGVASSPSREPGAVAVSPATWDVASSPSREPGAVAMSQAKWSTGIEARTRGLSRFDIPPHCVEAAACHAPPSRVGTPRYACIWTPQGRSACRIALEWHAAQKCSSWCVGTDRLRYPAIGQQERLHPPSNISPPSSTTGA